MKTIMTNHKYDCGKYILTFWPVVGNEKVIKTPKKNQIIHGLNHNTDNFKLSKTMIKMIIRLHCSVTKFGSQKIKQIIITKEFKNVEGEE